MTPKEQTPDAQPSESAPCPRCKGSGEEPNTFGLETCATCKGTGRDNPVKPASDQPSTSKPESGVSEEDYKRFNDWVLEHSGIATVWPKTFGMLALDYATKYERAKQAELVAEIKELERHKKELALCLEQANQLIRRYEGIEREQSAELEQLRSELDKLRTERVEMRDLLEKINEGECVYIENGQMFQDVSEMIAKLRGAN